MITFILLLFSLTLFGQDIDDLGDLDDFDELESLEEIEVSNSPLNNLSTPTKFDEKLDDELELQEFDRLEENEQYTKAPTEGENPEETTEKMTEIIKGKLKTKGLSPNPSQDIFKDLQKYEKKRYGTRFNLSPEQDRLFDPQKFRAFLRKGSRLLNLKTGQYVITKGKLNVLAETQRIGSSQSFILDKKGNKRYSTKTINLSSVEDDLNLRPSIDPLKVYQGKVKLVKAESEIGFEHLINYQRGVTTTNYFATIFRGSSTTVVTNRFEIKNYLKTDIPLSFGMILNYENSFWEDDRLGVVTFNSLNFGPTLRYQFWKTTTSAWNFHLGATQSLLHNSVKDPDTHSYSTIGLLLDLDRHFRTSYGTFFYGVGYRMQQSSVKSSTEFLDNPSVKGQQKNLSLQIGFILDWDYSWPDTL